MDLVNRSVGLSCPKAMLKVDVVHGGDGPLVPVFNIGITETFAKRGLVLATSKQ